MINLSLIFTPILLLQGVGQAPVAIKNDAPETWTLEYPRLIQPYVEDYHRCLTGQMRHVTGEANFEEQHRSDIPLCEEELQAAVGGANAAIAGRSEHAVVTPADVREIFGHLGRIHIARGADLDQQFTYLLRRSQARHEEYEAERPKGLVLELHDASVVKARTDATAAAAEAALAEREGARGAND